VHPIDVNIFTDGDGGQPIRTGGHPRIGRTQRTSTGPTLPLRHRGAPSYSGFRSYGSIACMFVIIGAFPLLEDVQERADGAVELAQVGLELL
jgi:hypothetical protein